MNLTEIQTSPPGKFRAVHKETRESYYFNLGVDDRSLAVDCVQLTECWIDLCTDHTDNKDKEIYGGDLLRSEHRAYLIGWDTEAMTWIVIDPATNLGRGALSGYHFNEDEIIGNIHQLNELSEDVRKMLEER